MARKGLLIDYQYCTGCQTCVVACKQEHGYPAGKWGIKVEEKVFTDPNKPDSLRLDYIPFPTAFCDLCIARTKKGEKPACVKHCQAWCMYSGPLTEMVKLMEDMPRSVLYSR
jgi:Fe-S-cluster-containing dehydrogenase component